MILTFLLISNFLCQQIQSSLFTIYPQHCSVPSFLTAMDTIIVLCPIVSEYLFDPRSWIQNKFVFLSQEGVMFVLHTFGPKVKGKAYCTLLM